MARPATTILLALLGVVALLGGCTTSSQHVEFVNASDTWLNLRFFVADPGTATMTMAEVAQASPGPSAYLSDARYQVRPGESLAYPLTRNPNYQGQAMPTVHVMAEPVTPSWMPAPTQYWLELLTPPPMTIVASGGGEELTFNSGGGTVAMIPREEIIAARFEHTIVNAPEVVK